MLLEPDDNSQCLRCCNCNVGVKLQLELVNHLLSHIHQPMKFESEEFSVDNESFTAEDEEDPTTVAVVKTKPSYHKKYNRRDRSPDTLKVQSEFTHDKSSKMFYCNFCRNAYKHKQTVERHLSKEHYPSSQPSASFVKSTASSQESFTVESQSKLFHCNICQNAYKHKQTIERHLAKEHNVEVTKSRAMVKLEAEGNEPSTAKRRRKEKNLICDKCGQRFLFRESLRKHLMRHMEPTRKLNKAGKTVREKIVCHCCTALVHPSLMKRHIQVHHSDYRPFRCTEPGCKTTFFDITKFNDHKNIHLNVKPYICEFCSETFHYASNYRQHKLRHTHPDRFKCDVCSSCFVSTKSLRMHLRLHNDDPDAPKPFACDQDGCDKAFRYLDRLKLHIFNVHRQEPEHKCAL